MLYWSGVCGGPTDIALKCPNINVTVVDTNPDKIKSWNSPLENLRVYEPGLAELVEKVRGKICFSQMILLAIEKAEMILWLLTN